MRARSARHPTITKAPAAGDGRELVGAVVSVSRQRLRPGLDLVLVRGQSCCHTPGSSSASRRRQAFSPRDHTFVSDVRFLNSSRTLFATERPPLSVPGANFSPTFS